MNSFAARGAVPHAAAAGSELKRGEVELRVLMGKGTGAVPFIVASRTASASKR